MSDSPNRICLEMLSDGKVNGERVTCLVLSDFLAEDRRIREEIKNKRLVGEFSHLYQRTVLQRIVRMLELIS